MLCTVNYYFNYFSHVLIEFYENKFFRFRKENKITEPLIGFPSPCTSEVLRLACNDELVKKSTVTPRVLSNSNDSQVVYEKLWAVRP